MSYSYTEKKRIRKNFGTFAKVMDLPNLIETQTKSYSEFLQADVAPEARKKHGLEEVFQSLFPIKSVSVMLLLNMFLTNSEKILMMFKNALFKDFLTQLH